MADFCLPIVMKDTHQEFPSLNASSGSAAFSARPSLRFGFGAPPPVGRIVSMIVSASQQSGIPPRGYSFTKVRHIVESFAPDLEQAPNPQAAKRIFDQMMAYIQQSKLPRRKRKRPSYPRAVWARKGDFPKRKK